MAKQIGHEQAYDRYFRMEKRSIKALPEELTAGGWSISESTLNRWSKGDRWQERIAECERSAREAADAAREDERRREYEQQRDVGRLMRNKGLERLMNTDPDDLTITEARMLIRDGTVLLSESYEGLLPATEDMTQTVWDIAAENDVDAEELVEDLAGQLEAEE